MKIIKGFFKLVWQMIATFAFLLIAFVLLAGIINGIDNFTRNQTRSTSTPRATIAPTRAPLTVELPQMMQEYSYTPVTRVTAKYKLTDIRTEIKKYFDGYAIVLYVSGEKTYDVDGANGTHAGHIRYKLYDQDGYVQETGTIYMDDYSVGDKFRDKEEYIYSVPAGHYRLELSDYK